MTLCYNKPTLNCSDLPVVSIRKGQKMEHDQEAQTVRIFYREKKKFNRQRSLKNSSQKFFMLLDLVSSQLMAQSHISIRESRVVLQRTVRGCGRNFRKQGKSAYEKIVMGFLRESATSLFHQYERTNLFFYFLYRSVKQVYDLNHMFLSNLKTTLPFLIIGVRLALSSS